MKNDIFSIILKKYEPLRGVGPLGIGMLGYLSPPVRRRTNPIRSSQTSSDFRDRRQPHQSTTANCTSVANSRDKSIKPN